MEQSQQKSLEQAEIIQTIAIMLSNFDEEYCRQAAKDMIQQASRQESMAVLNPSWPLLNNTLLRQKAKALSTLCDYVKLLKDIQEIKKQVALEENVRQNHINNLFM